MDCWIFDFEERRENDLSVKDTAAVAMLARRLRKQTLEMVSGAKCSHIGSAFSSADIMAALYSGIVNVSPETAGDLNRDRFLLSKGHAACILYAVLAEKGFFPKEQLETFYRNGSYLAGHVTSNGVPGVEVSTGSLGHGLSIAAGMAYAARLDNLKSRVWVLMSDGECDEGSVWEAAMFAGHHRLENLVAIIDYNKIQSIGTVKEVLDLEPFAQKWAAFNWGVAEIDGHDVAEILEAFSSVPLRRTRPTVVIAHTIKGKGVSFMEDSVLWHYRHPDGDELARARRELSDH